MSPRRLLLLHVLTLIAVWAALTLPSLGSTSLWDIDEGLNAEAAREMLESGNWIVPTFNFKPRTAKPALLYWFQATAYKHLGVTEFAARLPSAVAALGVVLLTYTLARRMFDPKTGLLAGIILATSIQFCLLAHAATPDMLLLFGVMLGLTLFWIGYEYDRRVWLVTCAVGSAFAVLAKGPVGVALPGLVIGLFLLSRGEVKRALDWRLAVGVLIFCVIALPWYVLVGSETRGAFLRGFWWNENVNRFLEPLENHRGPAFFYPLVLVIGLAPWCVFLVPTIWNAVREARDHGMARLPQRLLLVWAGAYLLFFTAAATKLPNYILPMYPPLAVLTARMLDNWRRGRLTLPAWIMPTCTACVALVGLVTATGLVTASGIIPLGVLKGNAIPGLERWAFVGLIPILTGAAAWHYGRVRRPSAATVALSAGAVAYLGLMITFPTRTIDARKAPRDLLARAGLPIPESEIRLASYGYFQPSLVFYAQREVTPIDSAAAARAHLASPLKSFLIAPAKSWQEMQPQAGRVLATHHDLYRNLDVVIVTNQ
ncbi:MAG: glycosyltransferase family 39 protein [Gemmataceae bacterium]|nr:glycosyltransferase family 39 protein [Gemmataceae bacterium]